MERLISDEWIKKTRMSKLWSVIAGKDVDIDNMLCEACETNDIQLVEACIQIGKRYYYSKSIEIAVRRNYIPIFILLKKTYPHSDYTGQVIKYNREEMFLLVRDDDVCHESHIVTCCRYGREKFFQYFLSKHPEYLERMYLCVAYMKHAYIGGNTSIINTLMIEIEKFGKSQQTDRLYHKCAKISCIYGRLSALEMMISKGVDKFNEYANIASKHGHIDILELLIEKGADDFLSFMLSASGGGHISIIKKLYSHCDYFDECFMESVIHNRRRVTRFFMKHTTCDKLCKIRLKIRVPNSLVEDCIRMNNISLAKEMIVVWKDKIDMKWLMESEVCMQYEEIYDLL